MATTEVIVTKFIADTGELDAQLDKAVDGLKGVETQGKKTEKETASLGATMGSTAVKVNMLSEAEARLILETKGASKALDTEAKSAKGAAVELNKVGQAAQTTGKQTSGLQGIFSKVSAGLGKGLDAVKGSFASIGTGVKDFFGKITSGAASAIPSLGGVGTGIGALASPIGIVTGAVVGLLANFSRLDSVGDTIDKIKAGFTSFLDSLAGNASLSDTIDGIQKAVELSERLDQLNDKKTFDSVAATEARSNAAELQRLARNTTVDAEERVRLLKLANAELDKASKLELGNQATEAQLAYEGLINTIIQQNNNLSEDQKKRLDEVKSLGITGIAEIRGLQAAGFDVPAEAFAKVTELYNGKRRLETEFTLTQERNQNSIDAVSKEFNDKEQARKDKAAADDLARAEKAKAERERIAKERASLEGQLIAITAEEEDAQLRKSLSTEEQRLFDIEKSYEKKAEAIRKLFESLKALPGADIPKLDAQQAQTLALNDTGKQQDTKAEEDKQRADREKAEIESAERISDALATEDERQRESIKDKYAKLLEDNDKYTTDVVERDKKKNALLEAQAKELSEILSKADEERIKKEKEDAEAKAKIQEETIDTLKTSAETAAVIIGEAAAAGTLTAEEASKQLVTLALDTIEKLVLLNAINAQTGALAFGFASGNPVAGIIAGIAVSALIKGLFAAAKATIAGAYYGEESIGGPATFPGEARDTHLRRVHPGERIVTAEKNRQHWQLLHALHTNKLEDFIERQYVRPRLRKVDGRSDVMPKAMPHAITGADVPEYTTTNNVMPTINAFLASERGHRVQVSVMPSMFHDKGIRDDLRSTRKAIEALPDRIGKAMEGKEGRQRTTRQPRPWR